MGYFKWYGEDKSKHLSHHGVKGQRWGVRRFQNKDGSRIRKEAKARVEKISSDVQNAAKNSGSEMYGLDHRLKTLQSINRKISKKVVEDGLTSEDAAKGIKDAVRFTTIAPANDFVNSYENFKTIMQDKGYTETRCKNYYEEYRKGKVKHKAVQSTFATDDGYEFEVQFHTPESQKAKDEKVPIYEERRTVGISPERAAYLEGEMTRLAESVPDPTGIERIKSH